MVSLVYSYDYFFTEVWSIEPVAKVMKNVNEETIVVCGDVKFKTDKSFFDEWKQANEETIKVHFSWLHGTPVGISFDGSGYYQLKKTPHSFRNFFPTLLFGISLLLIVYHQYSDWLLTLGLLPFFITVFLFLLTYTTVYSMR